MPPLEEHNELIQPFLSNETFQTTNGLNHLHRVSTIVRKRRRIILKNGECNIFRPKTKRERIAFLQFNHLVDSSWTFTIFVFVTTLFSSWLLFAVIWWLICFTHGDFEPNHLPPVQKQNNFVPCVYYVHNFASCLLFSIETQHTVGYGIKATTDECPEAIFVNALQCIIGFIMQGIMAVIIFSKMTLPRLRSQTLLFSKNAVICPKNENLCLMFRMGDMRKTHIIEAKVRAFFIRTERTIEGQILEHHQTELKLQVDQCKSAIFFNWPLVVYHKITQNSPLFFFTPNDLNQDSFEIVVVLEGTTQSTAQVTQARTSYLPSEIQWGKEFENLLSFDKDRREFQADFSKFDSVKIVETPLCSAACFNDSRPSLASSSKCSASELEAICAGQVNGSEVTDKENESDNSQNL